MNREVLMCLCVLFFGFYGLLRCLDTANTENGFDSPAAAGVTCGAC